MSERQPVNGLSKRLAQFTRSFHLSQAPPRVVSNAKLTILDCLGVTVLAARQEIGQRLRHFAQAHARSGHCTVWGMEIQTDARDAALLNGTLAHGLDYDDRNHATTYTLASSMAASTLCRVFSLTLAPGLMTRETVANETPASSATS